MGDLFIYTRVCTKCSQEKNLADFGMSRGKPMSRCLECIKAISKISYRNSPLYTGHKSPWRTTHRLRLHKPDEVIQAIADKALSDKLID